MKSMPLPSCSIASLAFLLTISFTLTGLETASAQAPEGSLWKTLAKITFRKEYDEIMGFKVDVPVYSQEVKALEGQTVEVKGYIIPVEGYKTHKEFVFSAYPYNMCYFCGGAGPETVMEVTATNAVKYTAEPIVLRGVLQLNTGDINRLLYSLQDAVQVDNSGNK